MKNIAILVLLLSLSMNNLTTAQDIKPRYVPTIVKYAFAKKYPYAGKVGWENEKGNFEANWGGKSGEDSSALFAPSGDFLQIEVAMPVNQLPVNITTYVHEHYKGFKIKEAGKITDASGRHLILAGIKGKDLIFDENGVFVREE